MLLSRFWYMLLGLLLGGAVFTLYIAQSMYNRTSSKVLGEGLSSDSQVVSWYLRSQSRERSAQLIKFALSPEVSQALQKSSRSEAIPKEARESASAALTKLQAQVPPEFSFDAVFAVDQHGRVVGRHGFEQAASVETFELGGYPVVADALHGYIRDDTFVWDRIYTVVTRPVEYAAGELPVGAIVGLRLVDDQFARDIAARTGAAVAFYLDGERVASGSPDSFDRSQLDGIVNDLKLVGQDTDYVEKGRSAVRQLGPNVAVVYTKLNGEAWSRGAGYVVGRVASSIASPFAFFTRADDRDKASVNLIVVIGVAAFAILLGILFTLLEHSRPLRKFVVAVEQLGAGKIDHLQASQVSGVYRKVVTLINDAIDATVAKGGGARRVADLQQVLGDVPDQPAMSAFAFGAPAAPTPVNTAPMNALPVPPVPPSPVSESSAQAAGVAKSLPKPPPAPGGRPLPPQRPAAAEPRPEPDLGAPPPVVAAAANPEWRRIFEDFLATKQQCGESTASLTYEKFEVTLRKNQQAIVDRHGVTQVKFSVYVKDGKAALKASPIRE
jgi:hypothetical protein